MTILHSAWMLQCYRSPLSSSCTTKLLSNFNNTRLLRPSSLNNNHLRSQARRSLNSSCAASTVEADADDTFYAEQGVSWSSLGLSDKLSRALSKAGFHRPSLVQAASVPKILSGKDVVVGAETGSGKTHSYLVPLMDRLSRAQLDSENASSDQDHDSAILQGLSLVLCPNVLLCEQVVQMANCLCGDDGKPLLKVAAVCGGQGWPVDEPNIVVSTPAALLNCIDLKRQRRLDFVRAVKYVVFDEADMLICGSFHNQVIRLINMFRFDEKQLSWSKEAVVKNSAESNSNHLSNETSDNEEELQSEFTLKGEEYSEGDVDLDDEPAKKDADSVKSKYKRRVRRKYYRSKQYIFVAATLPINGKKTAGAILKHMFPDAIWVSGNYLHRHNPRLEQRWVEVSVNTQVDALIKAVNEGFSSKVLDYGAGVSRTMIFANTVEAVEAVSKILQTADIECYRYHKDCSLVDRAKTIVDFREKGGILVCTDAAARGVDVPNVSHVIQADFATSAVDFLHRVGRTARAGQYGLVTSLYTESNRDLVAAVRQAAERAQPVEMAFSRKRSFRNKIKKRGSNGVKDAPSVEECVTA